jgi:hypothetical protein
VRATVILCGRCRIATDKRSHGSRPPKPVLLGCRSLPPRRGALHDSLLWRSRVHGRGTVGRTHGRGTYKAAVKKHDVFGITEVDAEEWETLLKGNKDSISSRTAFYAPRRACRKSIG